MFSATSFAIVSITNYNPFYVILFILSCYLWNRFNVTTEHVFSLANFVIESIYCAKKHVVTKLIQMTSKCKPVTCRRYVICCTLSLGFYQYWKILKVLSIPFCERFQFLKSIAIFIDNNFYTFRIF